MIFIFDHYIQIFFLFLIYRLQRATIYKRIPQKNSYCFNSQIKFKKSLQCTYHTSYTYLVNAKPQISNRKIAPMEFVYIRCLFPKRTPNLACRATIYYIYIYIKLQKIYWLKTN